MVDAFTRFLPGLKSSNSSVRNRTAKALRLFIESEGRDLSPVVYLECISDLSRRILRLLVDGDTSEKLAGIVAMDELVDLFNADSNDSKIIEFAHVLSKVLETATTLDSVFIRQAAKVLGHLVSTGGTTLIEFVEEFYLHPALTWLKHNSYAVRRCAAVMMLKELAINAPSIFYKHVDTFFEVIWPAMSDGKNVVREGTAEALMACFILIQQRDTNRKMVWYGKTLDQVEYGFIENTVESMHGAMLALNELLRNSGDFMYPHFEKVCKQVLQYKDHKSMVVKRAVVNLIPRLAKFNSNVFLESYFNDCATHLLDTLVAYNTTMALRGDTFVAVGKLALAVGSTIAQRDAFLTQTAERIRRGLQTNKKEMNVVKEALACLRMLAESIGPSLSKINIEEMIHVMFKAELNRILIETLTTISKKVPNQRSYIQVQLFQRLEKLLVVYSNNDSPSKSKNLKQHHGTNIRSLFSSDRNEDSSVPDTIQNIQTQVLALETLGTFDFQGNRHIQIMQFVYTTIVRYLDNKNAAIRKAAAITCCRLVLPPGEEAPISGEFARPVSAVLERLLTVGIADTEAEIRSKVLASLDSRFDPLLGQHDNLRCLFIALNDEIFEIRETAMNMLGRLTLKNPSVVMPALRQTLVQLLAELEFSGDSRGKEEGARLLGHLIKSANHLAKPFVLPILNALVSKLQDGSSSVSTSVMSTLGELATAGGDDLTPYLHDLLPRINYAVQEHSAPQKLAVAISTLGKLVSGTGYVIAPYEEYPDLLPSLCTVLQKSGDIHTELRLQAGRTIGIIGALDPYRLRHLKADDNLETKSRNLKLVPKERDIVPNLAAIIPNLKRSPAKVNISQKKKEFMKLVVPPEDLIPSLVDDPSQYFPTVAINALIRILNEPRNENHYQGTFLAIMYICNRMRGKVEPHLAKIIPTFLYSFDCVNANLRVFLFEQLTGLVRLVGDKVEKHMDHVEVLCVISGYWNSNLNEILNLFEEIARSLGDKFKVYLPDLLPELLRIIRREREESVRVDTQLVLRTFMSLGRLLEGYLHLIVPVLVKLIQGAGDVRARRQALAALRALVRELDVSDFASKIIHMLARVIGSSHVELVTLAMDCLCCMLYTLGEDYAMFVPILTQVLQNNTIEDEIFDKYNFLVSKILKYQPLPVENWIQSHPKNKVNPMHDTVEDMKALPIDQNVLKNAWESSQRSTKDDWYEWMRAFSVELLRESPSPALRACKELASVHQPLATELFNAAFVSVWPQLGGSTQENLVRSLEGAFNSPHLPGDILQTLLNLAEFMEHDDQPLPVDIRMLGALAEKCHSYAKALHYQELEFNTTPNSEGIEALISVNNKLNQFEAAVGILNYAQGRISDLEVKPSWHEKLHRWDDALAGHDRKLAKQPNNVEAIFGKMRCLYAVGQWRKLNTHVDETWRKVYGTQAEDPVLDVAPAMKKELCSHAARVALTLQNWDLIPRYINSDMDETESHLYGVVYSIRNMKLDDAALKIKKCRRVLDPTLRSLVSESYSRAYMPGLIYLQNLTELEEIIEYTKLRMSTLHKTKASEFKQDEHLNRLRKVWTKRMKGVEKSVNVWQHLLVIRSIVLDPRDDADVWLKYAHLCRKGDHMNLALSALWRVGARPFIESIGSDPEKPLPITIHGPDAYKPHPKVAFSYLRLLFASGNEEVAIKQLEFLTEILERATSEPEDIVQLRVHAYIKLAVWKMSYYEPKNRSAEIFQKALGFLNTATELDPDGYRAWHEWALMNFRAAEACARENSDDVSLYAVPAVSGFFKSILLGYKLNDVTKDILRLLTFWFAHGSRNDVHNAMSTGFHTVSINTWLDVIPQLIARIHTSDVNMSSLLSDVLSRIGRSHPQALIYPITVAAKSIGVKRKVAASAILADVRRHSLQLVEEAELVSLELIRVAILWNELWFEAIEDASRCYFNMHDANAMIEELKPLHQMLENARHEETMTLRELAFYQAFARELKVAEEWTTLYSSSRNVVHLNQAWEIYYTVFGKIRKQLNNLTALELSNVAPRLLSVNNLSLAIPGTYRPDVPIVRIQSFSPKITVLTSKQRPRKVTMLGSDGKIYPFLLKGHEDLRQDERVMQLFGLINTLLANDNETSRRNLAIQRYSVMPLSHSSGLIGWVPNCDTLHQLIRDYRDARKIQLNVEHRLMLQVSPDYEKLPTMHKVEAFKYALSETTGQDLYRVLWLKSQSSEVWLERRRNYTTSLAVMSMAGYILGLGDRHPSNLMLDRPTGKIVHIDFGDCFEVAAERDKFPEKVPFRLTRMLIHAMEVSGIEGSFRFTCERVLRVLRDNRDSLMAVLEAFIHDPLITWRLLARNAEPSPARPGETIDVTTSVINRSSAVDSEDLNRTRQSSTETMMDLIPKSSSIARSFNIAPEAIIRENEELDMAGSLLDKNLEESNVVPEQLNQKALKVIDRVKSKLRGRDFDGGTRQLSVEAQVDRLVEQATSHENLSQLYYGWCPFW